MCRVSSQPFSACYSSNTSLFAIRIAKMNETRRSKQHDEQSSNSCRLPAL